MDVCVECGGVWLDFGELEKVLDGAVPEWVGSGGMPGGTDAVTDLVKVACPACGGPGRMLKVRLPEHPEILLDVCKICHGMWVDSAEVAGLRRRKPAASPLVILLGFFGL